MASATSTAIRDATNQPTTFYRVVRTFVAIASGVLVVLLQVKIGGGFGSSLDAAWGEVLNWGIAHGAQWGTQLVFTYGPLGFLMPGLPFDPATYWTTLILQHVFAIATAWLVVVNLRRLPLVTGLVFLLATIILGWAWSTSSALIIVYPLAILALERVTYRTVPNGLGGHLCVAGLAAYAALLPLIKFSTFPLWLVWLPLGVFMLWRSHVRSLVVTFVIASVIAPVIAWLACGQHLGNIPAFLATSWQAAIHYGAAMQLEPANPVTDWVALGATLFGIACAVLLAWRARLAARPIGVCAMFAFTLALAYRAGAIRAEGGHLMILFAVCAWCAPLLIGMLYEACPVHGARHAAMTFVLAILALTLPPLSNLYPRFSLDQMYRGLYTLHYSEQRISNLLHPQKTYADRLQKWTSDRNDLALPKIARTVGDDPVDVLMDAQSWLLANDLHYRPRPVFQSYAAYSGQLMRLNDKFFRSRSAPPWVMLQWRTATGGYPTTDDAFTLIHILQDYRPVLSEDGFLLFRHDNDVNRVFASGKATKVPVHFTATTMLPKSPADAWFAQLKVKLTAYGKLRTLLFRQPILAIAVTLRDGTHKRYHLVRAIAKAGFMLDPAIADNDQYLDWLLGNNDRDVTSVRLVQQRFLGHEEFKIDGPMRLYPLQLPRKQAITLALYPDYFPGFNQVPASIIGKTRSYKVDGQLVLFLGTPGSLTFHLQAGVYDVTAKFGLMPNALTDAACLRARPDGVGMQVGIQGEPVPPGSATYMNPFADPQHRYVADYAQRLVVGPSQTVVVSLTKGPPGSNGACDWSWIRDLRFERATPPH